MSYASTHTFGRRGRDWTVVAVSLIASVTVLLTAAAPSSRADQITPKGTPTGPKEVRPKLFVDGAPAVPESRFEAMSAYLNTRRASLLGWADNGLLIRTAFGETTQVHRVSTAGGAREQLTFGKEPVRGALWTQWKGRKGLLLLRDVGGAEAYQIIFQDLATGRLTTLTKPASNGKPSRALGMSLSRDGRWLTFANTARNGVDYDVYVMDLSTETTPRLVMKGNGFWVPQSWSPDHKHLLVQNYISANESSVWRVAVATGKRTRLAPPKSPKTTKVYDGMARFSADGKGAYFVSNRWAQYRQLGYVDFSSDKVSLLTGKVQWDIEALDVDPKGKRIAYAYNEGGVSRLKVLQLSPVRALQQIPALPVGIIGNLDFNAAGTHLALSLNGPKSPGDCYVVDLDSKPSKLTPWTRSEVGGMDPNTFIAPTVIDFHTFDRAAPKDEHKRRIPAFYFKPKGKGPFPVVIAIHGGPESQWRPHFRAVTQHWVRDLGIAVIAPNVRGSAGYGKEYLLLDNGFKREDSVKDIGALLKWVGRQKELNASKVAVFGGSYGGYMVLASMARYADKLVAGADVVGISNFVTFLKNTKRYRVNLRRAEYGDERKPKMRAFLEKISPTNLVHLIKDPLLVAQGLNDPRVPASESQQIVDRVRAGGVPVWYLLAHDEGHGFRKRKNRDYFYALLTEFWRKHLL